MAIAMQQVNDFDLDEASQANASEISFPSHVSGLESFSDFDRTFPAFSDEKPPDQFLDVTDNKDAADISDGLLDLNTPSTQREKMVFKFLTEDRNPKPLLVDDQKPIGTRAKSAEANVLSDMKPQTLDQKAGIHRELGQRSWDEEGVAGGTGFDVGMEINQRPGLDGSSSDSDDGAVLNFARSRIGTINQQHLIAALEDREQNTGTEVLEERQLAEGDDVFPRVIPGDGGGGGDGSSGHSDSDVDGDGGVAIRMRSQRSQQGRIRATAAIQPIRQQNEDLPERERPVGDSVPAFNQQIRSQIQNGIIDASEELQYSATSRSDAPTSQDMDSGQESRLSARYFATSSLARQSSSTQYFWMEDDNSLRFSESATVSPGNDDDIQDTLNNNTDTSSFDSLGARNVVGDDNEADKTITSSRPSLLMESQETPMRNISDTTIIEDSVFEQAVATSRISNENISSISTNPFHQSSESSTNPFTSIAYNKNPFDPMNQSELQNAFSFSGFGDQNVLELEASNFKLNSQEAEALFEEDEKSFQHSNTISKLANTSSDSAWNLEDFNGNGEVRLSKYFNAMSEELGSMSLDRPDRPRPVFDDYKVVKTPPALRPFALHAGETDEPATSSTSSFSFEGQGVPGSVSKPEQKTAQSIPIPKFSSTYTMPKSFFEHHLAEATSANLLPKNCGEKGSIQANQASIKIPETNDEAECLLHDIGVGRVSLRGVSGVNVSNLAAKIAVATNSDPKLILNLLIPLIESEQAGINPSSLPSSHVPEMMQLSTGVARPNSQAADVFTAPKNLSSTYSISRPQQQDKSFVSADGTIADGLLVQGNAHSQQSAIAVSGKQDQSTMMLSSDLDSTLSPVKSIENALKNQGSVGVNTVSSSFGANSNQSAKQEVKGSPSIFLPGQIVSQTQNTPAEFRSGIIRHATVSVEQDKYQLSAIHGSSFPQVTRPVSSVIPLVALPESRPLYRDSGVQCLTQTRHEKLHPVERGASFERSVAQANRNIVSTVDAAIQCDVSKSGNDFSFEREAVCVSQQNFKSSSNATSNSNIKAVAGRHLSSTAIFGDESYEHTTKGITLSPVMPEVESSLFEQGESTCKPLNAVSQKRRVELAESHGPHGQLEKPVMGRLSDPNKNLIGAQIDDILPRISDIKVRESNAIFYPLMASNQTIMGRPSVAQSTQIQSPVQLPPKHQIAVKNFSTNEKITHGGSSKLTSLPTIQIIVPNEVRFSDVQCIGVSVNECLPIHNPSSRWIQCMLEVVFYSVNGSQVEVKASCAFGMQPKVFIAPHTTEDIKVTFHAEHAGVYMAKVNAIASPVITDESTLSGSEIYPNVIHIEGVAEIPDIEIFHEQSDEIHFGEMPGGIVRARSLKLVNKGRADIPLKLVLSGNAAMWQHFAFVDADMVPIGSAISDSLTAKDETQPPVLNIILPGYQQKSEHVPNPEVVWIQFKAPQFKDKGLQMKIGPPNEYAARVDIEIDTSKNGIIVGSVLLKAVVGIARLHAPRSLQAVSLSTTEGQRVSRGIPFRNAGNISLDIQLQVSTLTDLFSVVPEHVRLSPGQSSEVFVHFLSMECVTIESFLLVSIHPDGPQYEVVLRGTATTLKPVKEKEEKPVLLCNKPVLCWAGIPIGRSMQQRAYLRNNSMSKDLQLTLAVEGNHSDFQIQNTFDFKERSKNNQEVTLKPQSEVPIHVLFVPSTFGMISSALVIRSVGDGPKFKSTTIMPNASNIMVEGLVNSEISSSFIAARQDSDRRMIPLHGYGGCSILQLTNAQKIGDNYWIDAGEVSTDKQNIVKLSLQNIGNRAAFVKVVCYSDVSKREIYPSSHISIAPNEFVLLENCTKQLVVVLQPTESVLRGAKDKPCAAVSLAIFSGDESLRKLYRKNRPKSSQIAIEKEGHMQNIVFDAPFLDEDKVKNDITYPDISNWESFFLNSTSRTVISLVAKPTNESRGRSSTEMPLKFDPKEFIIDQTPARPLPVDSTTHDARRSDLKAAHSEQQNKEAWAVLPEHIVLTAPNTDKSTARLQMINYSDKPLGFEFSWPAQSLIITPSKDNVPPRSQLIIFVSTKPSFLSTGGELPWRGNIYVQCEGVQKCVRVQIREDLALDASPLTTVSQRLAPLHPSNTPFRFKQPIKGKSLVCVEPTSVIFQPTIVNKFQDNVIKIESTSSATLKWVLSSIAPPYFKEISERGDIFRTTYTAFRFTKHSGQLQPNEETTVQIVFQPRDCGEYSQFWDLQVGVASTGETSKMRVEVRGKGIPSDSILQNDDGKVVGRAHPILKPPPDLSSSDQAESGTLQPAMPSKSTEQTTEAPATNLKGYEKKPRGIFVKDDVLIFESKSKSETSEMQFRLCNDSKEFQKVRFSGLKPPFSMKLNKLAIRKTEVFYSKTFLIDRLVSKSFIRVPVYFTPIEADSKSEGMLEVNALTGTSRTCYVRLVGVCHAK